MDHIRVIKGDEAHLADHEIPIGAVYKNDFMQRWKIRAGGA